MYLGYVLAASQSVSGSGLLFIGLVMFLGCSAFVVFGKEPIRNSYQWGRWQAMKLSRWLGLLLAMAGAILLITHR